jgi:hypothetical protein
MTTALALGVKQGAAATAEAHYIGRKTDALSAKDTNILGPKTSCFKAVESHKANCGRLSLYYIAAYCRELSCVCCSARNSDAAMTEEWRKLAAPAVRPFGVLISDNQGVPNHF